MIAPYDKCPTYTIDLNRLYNASEISGLMKSKDIISYVYIFTCSNGVLKYGYSSDNSRQHGDRVYRQAGHLDGWGYKLNGSSGSDMRVIADNYKTKYGINLDRSDVKLTIIDLSKHGTPGSQEHHCKTLERLLIDNCIERNGAAPIGNIDNVTESNVRRHKNSKQLEKFFEFIN